ncbi:MAG: SGNH/GDSL hydrolase family protein [Clostridia bacterium]|nr:SGNH/GDSL hydrolase family protein [Clostridia bacterium]MBQ7153362.1 SGNH/GDSL hydrolase family protein [Clostridia bacterium]
MKHQDFSSKKILCLGSSVTFGTGSNGVSFADMLNEYCGAEVHKHAVGGTTLADNSSDSYVSRLLSECKDIPALDYVLVQLSTNDAGRGNTLGCVSPEPLSADLSVYDRQTVVGAIEFIIKYAKDRWHCPVGFYTGTKFQSEPYEKMVAALLQVKEKWHIGVLDLWSDPEMLSVSPEDYQKYMKDPVHPSLEGYRDWWLPKFEAFLAKEME